jgi:hypothetical protein
MSTPTEDQIKKYASQIEAHKHRGFIAHLHAQGIKKATIKETFDAYVPQDRARASNIEKQRQLILSELGK